MSQNHPFFTNNLAGSRVTVAKSRLDSLRESGGWPGLSDLSHEGDLPLPLRFLERQGRNFFSPTAELPQFSIENTKGRATLREVRAVRRNWSFAPLGLVRFPRFPRLAPWAGFLRRFAAKNWDRPGPRVSRLRLPAELDLQRLRFAICHLA